MKQLFKSAFLALILVLSFGVASAHAAAVNGWAWSSNIGWVQFDTGVSSPVDVDLTTGNMSGYAWSSNIGWISFYSSSCGAQANVNLATGNVTGWIKALSADGNGWDGCIELSGTNHTTGDTTGNSGVTMKTATGEFVGYAWGGPVVGWVQFNPTAALGTNINCPGCTGGGVAPVITGSCVATSPNTNLTPNSSVSYKVTATNGIAPYQYSWEGLASTSANTYSKSYPATNPTGPFVRMGDSSAPVKGYSSQISCPGATVLQPIGAANLHIGRGSNPTAATLSSLAISQGTVVPFILAWNLTMTNDYSCTASIGNDPNLANWNAGWKTIVLNASNGTDNGDGTITWNSNTGANLSTPASGLNIGPYVFKLSCTGGAAGPQSASATLRIVSTTETEI